MTFLFSSSWYAILSTIPHYFPEVLSLLPWVLFTILRYHAPRLFYTIVHGIFFFLWFFLHPISSSGALDIFYAFGPSQYWITYVGNISQFTFDLNSRKKGGKDEGAPAQIDTPAHSSSFLMPFWITEQIKFLVKQREMLGGWRLEGETYKNVDAPINALRAKSIANSPAGYTKVEWGALIQGHFGAFRFDSPLALH